MLVMRKCYISRLTPLPDVLCWFALVRQTLQRFRQDHCHVPSVNLSEREVSVSSRLKRRNSLISSLVRCHSPALGSCLSLKKLVKVIIADKLAFANKEADPQIWSLKGHRGPCDHHPMTRRWGKNDHKAENYKTCFALRILKTL